MAVAPVDTQSAPAKFTHFKDELRTFVQTTRQEVDSLRRHTLTLETGEIARQAGGAVLVELGDTVVLVTAVAREKPKPGQDFFPLTVDYQEKTYAAGKIPAASSSAKGVRRKRNADVAIDRPSVCGRFSRWPLQRRADRRDGDVGRPEIDPDIAAMIGAPPAARCRACRSRPIGAARVGYIDGQYVLNPTKTQLDESQLNSSSPAPKPPC
jgi:polyribonucleotide nucleotidyltransferase